MPSYKKTIEYFLADFPRTLFPLDTNRIIVEHAATDLGNVVYKSIGTDDKSEASFLAQTRAYAAKPNFHLRRTLKLDAVAEFFLYDITYRHRAQFKVSPRLNRRVFGYGFKGARMISPARSYHEFRKAVRASLKRHRYCVKVDIAQYFNSVYHHDIVHWFRPCANSNDDVVLLGRFFREINAGRSIDCLPHGIYPAKIIGSQFLLFVEETSQLSAAESLRFMDDIYLFDHDWDVLARDFQVLQRLLGAKGLTVNGSKTQFGRVDEVNVEREVDNIKVGLLKRRGDIVLGSGAEDDYWENDEHGVLTQEETEYLLGLLNDEHLEEEDAELILAVMRDHSDDVLGHVKDMLGRFPSLSKNIYHFAKYVADKAALLGVVKEFVRKSPVVTEFQLFWLGKLCQDVLLETPGVDGVMIALFQHPAATPISKGKILEITEKRFGMPDLREGQLTGGSSDWLSWCAAVGSRHVPKAKRNHLLIYFAKGSWFNELIARCVRSFV
jgi:hypothetical protein